MSLVFSTPTNLKGPRGSLMQHPGVVLQTQFIGFLDWLERGAASANVPLAEPSPNARLPEAANDDDVAWPLIRFPDSWHAAC
jgi:hypothetical protein